VTPQSRKSLRNKPPFNLREILLYGIPFWIGAPIAGWYLDGWLGFKSSVIGLLLLGAYIGSTAIVAEKTKRTSAKKAVAFAVASFWTRLFGLWLLVYLLSHALELNLLVLLLTVAFGFTAILAISAKNWLQS